PPTYDAHTGTTMVRYNANELTFPPGEMLCRLGSQLTPERLPDLIGKTCDALGSATEGLPDLPSISQVLNTLQTGNLPPLPLPGVDDANKALPGTKDAAQSSSTGKEADESSSADKEGAQGSVRGCGGQCRRCWQVHWYWPGAARADSVGPTIFRFREVRISVRTRSP